MSAAMAVLGLIAAALFAPLISNWFWRGQTPEEAAQLTGRTKVWSDIFGLQRPWLEQAFGSGLSNKSFNGLPIDSNWLARSPLTASALIEEAREWQKIGRQLEIPGVEAIEAGVAEMAVFG